MFTDTHCHVLSSEYNNISDIIDNLEKNNIKRIIVNGFDQESNEEVISLVNKYPNVYGALGIHPDSIDEINEKSFNYIKNNLDNPKIIAIGEIGLDYYHNKDNREDQLNVFEKFLKLAESKKLPVIIHSRESTEDTITMLKKHKCKGILHSFTGSLEVARIYKSLGYKIGINGIITFKNAKLYELVKNLNLDDILLETDSPYLTPEPLRKYRNTPFNINVIADKISEIKNIKSSELSLVLENNFNEIFDIYP